MIRGLVVTCILAMLSGCASLEDKIQNVSYGVSKNQVIALLGKPDGSMRSGKYEALRYSNHPVNDGSPVGSEYNVIFADGFVIDYGYGYVRENNLRESNPSYNNRLIIVSPK
jgi:hypothetical protein